MKLKLLSAYITSRPFLLGALFAGLLVGPGTAPGAVVSFGSGSLVVPMDTGANGQNQGMLRAYGLVYDLLRNGVPVNWVINPAKSVNGDDFSITAPASLQDVRTGATVTSPRSYRGGPFVIAAADAAAAMPVIQAWQAKAGDNTAVHRFIGAGVFSADVARTLVRAPRIGVIKDGNETIAFNDLNAAGIGDSTGGIWTAASPDVLAEAALAGATTFNHADGVLFDQSNGYPRYCFIAAMHYNTTANTPEVIQEVGSWLSGEASLHAFMMCEAARAIENSGFFLTTAGLDDDGSPTTNPAVRAPSSPLVQMDGAFEVDTGAVDSIGLNGVSMFRTGVTTLINDLTSSLLHRIVMLSGRMDGVSSNGRVTYLAGHDYSIDLPITANPQTNGVRLFLNSLFASDCAATSSSGDIILTKSAPAYINSSQIPYTITWTNPGPQTAENVQVVDVLPVGSTYVVGSGNPAPTTVAGSVVTWNLPPIPANSMSSITFLVSATVDGPYANTATMRFSNVAVRTTSSSPTTTVRDTVSPALSIIAGPTGTTSNPTPSFRFTTDATAISKLCAIDNVNFVPCAPDPAEYTSAPLSDGPHTFDVRVSDAAGNTASASRSFTVATTPTLLAIEVTPTNPAVPRGGTLQFTATGTFSDGSSQDLTTTATWSSSDPSVASVSNANGSRGRATGISVGTTQVSARVGTVVGTTTLTVTGATLVAVNVTPVNSTITAGLTQQFTATGTFSDGTARDLTATAQWSSSAPSIATISNAVNSRGLATGASPGTTQISAQSDSVTGSTTLTVTSAPGCQLTTSSASNFNGTAISKNSYIWFSSVLKPKGLGSTPATFRFVQQQITSTSFTIPVPDATVIFDPAATIATTTFTGGVWVTRVPSSGLSGNTFLSGLSYMVPANLAGGLKNVTWSGTIIPDTPGTSLQWQWAAAVYSTFSGDYNAIGVKPVDDNKASQYKNSDHAGTPENFKTGVVGGATGGGGSNYTGSLSGTEATSACDPTPPLTLTKSAPAVTNSTQIQYTISYTNPSTKAISNIQLSDALPAGLTYLAGSGTPAPSSISGNVLTWNLPSLAAHATASVVFRVSVTTDGTYNNTAGVRFTQAVGAISSNTVTTVRDTVPPTVTIVAGPIGDTNVTNPSFQFTTGPGVVQSECAIDNGSYVPCAPVPSQYTSGTLAQGPHTFTVRAFDAAGNTASASRVFNVDLTAPVVTFAAPPTNPTVTNNPTPRFYFTVDDVSATTFCSVAGDPFAPCTSPFTTRSLPDGAYTVSAYARDAAGNTGPTANFSFVIDAHAPIISIPVPPNLTSSNNNRPTFTFSDVGPVGTAVTFQCRVDAGANTPCASPFTVATALADGTHTLIVTGTDAAGNVGQASLNFIVDTVAPIVTIPGAPSNPPSVSSNTPSLVFSVSNTPNTTPIVFSQCTVVDASPPNTVRAQSPPNVICDTVFNVPVANALADGNYTFMVRATDAAGNSGSASLPFAVALNHAPVLDPNPIPILSPENEDAGVPAGPIGTLVSSLVDFASVPGGLDNVTDIDSGAQLGIAVVGADTTHGTWYYSLDNGTSWIALGMVADSNALLLAANGSSRLYFRPSPDFNGVLPNAITFRAWDQTQGGNGQVMSAVPNGGSTAFSSATDIARLTINGVNDAPVLDPTKSPLLNPESEDAGAPVGAVGTLVSALVDFANIPGGIDNVIDVDSGAQLGIAVVGADTTHGTWYYSLSNGASWIALGGVTDSNALLLGADGSSRLYFRPSPGFNGVIPGAITFRAWDQTSGADGIYRSTSPNGGTTAFSVATDTASLTISSVNAPPVSTAPASAVTQEDAALVFTGGNSLAVSDPDNSSLTITLSATHGTLTMTSLGGLAFTAGNGTNNATMTFAGTVTNLNVALGTLVFNPTPDYHGSATITFSTTDGIAAPVERMISVTVFPVSDVVDDAVSTSVNTPVIFNPITGAGGASADTFSGSPILTNVTQGAHGTVSFMPDGSVTYTPAAGYTGTDSFTYTVTSGGVTETGTVTVTII